jgi:hypothetical protein
MNEGVIQIFKQYLLHHVIANNNRTFQSKEFEYGFKEGQIYEIISMMAKQYPEIFDKAESYIVTVPKQYPMKFELKFKEPIPIGFNKSIDYISVGGETFERDIMEYKQIR